VSQVVDTVELSDAGQAAVRKWRSQIRKPDWR
jgi:hypothetical protein